MGQLRSRGLRALPTALGAGALTLLISSCSGPPEPGQEKPQLDDCLRNVDLSALPALIQRCDAVVKTYPDHPQPLNERALLHKLAGQLSKACKDSLQAAEKLRTGKVRLDALMADEIELRRRNCERLTSDRAAPAPSSAKPAAAPAGARD
ncbi:MAG: hypothetical protein RLZZ32_1695 [Cyanobacteriota bacterium]|jgi:hypothetical protein